MKVKYILKGTRPKTLIAAVVPCMAAAGVSLIQHEGVNVKMLLLCLGLAISIQIATNFYNDAVDYMKGADSKRIGPERITTQDNQSARSVFFVGHAFIFLALAFGIPLILHGGIPILILGVLSLYFAYGYTGGPFPLAYLGLGELFVFLFFGLVATVGTYYLMTLKVSVDIWIIGAEIGLLSSVLIGVNNFRDHETDREVGKNTLATKLNKSVYLFLMDMFIFCPYLLSMFFVVKYHPIFLVNTLSLIIGMKISKGLKKIKSLEQCNYFLAMAGKHMAIFCILFLGASGGYYFLS